MPKKRSKALSSSPAMFDTDVQGQKKFWQEKLRRAKKAIATLDRKSEAERARRHRKNVRKKK